MLDVSKHLPSIFRPQNVDLLHLNKFHGTDFKILFNKLLNENLFILPDYSKSILHTIITFCDFTFEKA